MDMTIHLIFTVITYIVLVIFLGGFLYKIWIYATTPAPLKIPTTPAPTSKIGVAGRIAGEVIFFKSLFKGNKWIWLGGYLLHIAFLLLVLRHLRYFINPVPEILIILQQAGIYAGMFLVVPIVFLLYRRFMVDRIRYISSFGDFFILFLLLSIVLSGIGLKYFYRVNVLDVKMFMMGILTFHPVKFPDSGLFIVHYSLLLLFLIYFPFSKLMHAGGIFFSPALNQVDNPREKRHSIS